MAMLQNAIDTPESEWPAKLPRSAPPAVIPHSELLAALKLWRDEKAVELNLDNSLVANKNQLVWLAVPGNTPWETRYENAHLLGWQKTVWNQILQEHLDKAERIGE
jgi:ribonuclease D